MPLHKNPILSGFNPDPSIVRVGKDFFMVTSTFEYFPGLPIYHSKDLIAWQLIGHALTRRSQFELRTAEPGSGIWAPTLRHHNGRFYIATCSWTGYCPQQNLRVWPRGFYISTADIWQAEWSDPIYFDQPGFDQDLFWDDDGRLYLSTCYRSTDHDPRSNLKGFAVHISEIDLATGRSLSPPVVARRSPSGVAEGSHIVKRGKYYYLFTAEGGTESGHSEWVFRSQSGPQGPYEVGLPEPLLSSTLQDDVQNTGHADLVEDAEGNWWAVCLAVRPTRVRKVADESSLDTWIPSPLKRETFLLEVEWENDWPIFNQGQKLQLSFESHQEPAPRTTDWQDDFQSPTLSPGWYTKNTPLKQEYSLTERPGWLRLHGGPYNLHTHESPTMLLRKQTSITGTWTTKLDFDPARPSHEAGIVLYWNLYTFASIGIRRTKSDNDREIRITQPAGEPGTFKHLTRPLASDEAVTLGFACSATSYKLFLVSEDDATSQHLADVPATVMTADPPKGMAFTGMMFGLYAFGEMEPCLSPADFEYAKWTDATG